MNSITPLPLFQVNPEIDREMNIDRLQPNFRSRVSLQRPTFSINQSQNCYSNPLESANLILTPGKA